MFEKLVLSDSKGLLSIVLGSKMPPKKNSTPIKPSEGYTMTHEEEEVQHDISKLQEQVQQISLSQRVTKNEWKLRWMALRKVWKLGWMV